MSTTQERSGNAEIPGGNGQDEHELTITGIDISGHENIVFSGLFAGDGDDGVGVDPYDEDDHIHVFYSVDGGAEQLGLAFESVAGTDGNTTNEIFSHDTDLNGFGDGARLVPTFASFSFNIPNGSTLDLRVAVEMDGGGEEIAFDNLQIEGDPVTTNAAPTVSSHVAADVGEAEIGDTSYQFTVTYSDNSAIDVSTLTTADVTVDGPVSIGSLAVTNVNVDVPSDGTPRTATYTVTPPGGSWDAADNGLYNISLNANEVGDDGAPQLFAAATAIGSFNVAANNTNPSVRDSMAEPIVFSDLGTTSYDFTIEYVDVGGIDTATIDVNDVTVTGPGGPITVSAATTSDANGSHPGDGDVHGHAARRNVGCRR